MQTTPTTELEAVNIMLSTIGEAPVNALDLAATYDLTVAKRVLAEVVREAQSFGWKFNSDTDVPLAKDVNGRIAVPTNMLRLVLKPVAGIDPVVRGAALYDRKNRTAVFTRDLVARRVIYLLPFDQMPETARHYCAIRAARIFQYRIQGDQVIHQFSAVDEIAARSILRKDQSEEQQMTMLTAPGVAEVIDRSVRQRWR